MRQSGDDPSQALFRDVLLRLRNCEVTKDDWRTLMTRIPVQVSDTVRPGLAMQFIFSLL